MEYDEKHRVLTDYHELIVGWENERQEKSDDEKVMAGEMRKQATERLRATKRRERKCRRRGVRTLKAKIP